MTKIEEQGTFYSFKTGAKIELNSFFPIDDFSVSEKNNCEMLSFFDDIVPKKKENYDELGKSININTEKDSFPWKIPNQVRHLGIIVNDEAKLKETDIPFHLLSDVHIKYEGKFPSGRSSILRHPKVQSLFLEIRGDEFFKPELKGLDNIRHISINVKCDDGKFFYSGGKEVFKWIADFKNLELLVVRGDSCRRRLEFDPLSILSSLAKLRHNYILGFEWSKHLGSVVSKNTYFEFRNESIVEGKLGNVKFLDIYGDFPVEISSVIANPNAIESIRLFGVSNETSVFRIIKKMNNLRHLYIKTKNYKGGVIKFEKFKMLEDLHIESNSTLGNIEITGNRNLKRLTLVMDLKKNESVILQKLETIELLKLHLNGAKVELKSPLSSIKAMILEGLKIEGFGIFSFPALEGLSVNTTSKNLDISGAYALRHLILRGFNGRMIGGFKGQRKIESLSLMNSNFEFNINDTKDKIRNLFIIAGDSKEKIDGKILKSVGIERLVIKSALRSRKQNLIKWPLIYPLSSLVEVEISGLEFERSLLIELSKIKNLKVLKLAGAINNRCEKLLENCEINRKNCKLFDLDCDALELPEKTAFSKLENLEIEEISKKITFFKKHYQYFANLKNLKAFKYENWKGWNLKFVSDVFRNSNWKCSNSESTLSVICRR